jgi:TRAP-type C4-dicarboxylate transport system permease small subunit
MRPEQEQAPVIIRLWRLIERATLALLVALFATMTLACTAQVIWRYAFGDPLIWSEELARYLFIWIGYLSAWVAWKHRAHIALDAVTYLNNPRLTALSGRLVEALVLGFCLYTLNASFALVAIAHAQPSAVLEVPMSLVYAGYSAMAVLIGLDIVLGWLAGARAPAAAPVAEV